MARKFLRRIWNRYSKLGKGRKKKQVWRRPTGRDNKMREKRKGYPAVVSVGYKGDKNNKGNIQGKQPIVVKILRDLEGIGKDRMIIIGRVGKKRKIELVNKVNEMKLQVYRMNVGQFIEKNILKGKKIKAQENKAPKTVGQGDKK